MIGKKTLRKMNCLQWGAVILASVLFVISPWFESANPYVTSYVPIWINIVGLLLLVFDILLLVIFLIKFRKIRSHLLFPGIRNVLLIGSAILCSMWHHVGWHTFVGVGFCGGRCGKKERQEIMETTKKYCLLLLAGGKSSRMGQNKAQLLYKGKTFLETLISKGKQLGIEQVYVSGFCPETQDIQVVQDIFPERGPLGGLHACMKKIKTPYCLVLPVDVPQIPVKVLEKLLEFHEEKMNEDKQVPILLEHGDRRENLIGIYPVEIVDLIETTIAKHSAPVYKVLQKWGYECCRMDIPQWQVENINTPEAYNTLLHHTEY